MKTLLTISLAAIFIFAGCSEEERDLGEVVSAPSTPVGPDTAYSNEPVILASGGSVSSQGHPVEYRFDFDAEGNHEYGEWSPSASDTNVWSVTGSFAVKAQARCASHTDVVSPWSDSKIVIVVEPPVSQPWTPAGSSSTEIDEPESYCTGGAVSEDGDPVEYRFDFDAGGVRDTTDWSDLTCVTHSWTNTGNYVVKAQARSAVQTYKVSSWSDGLAVTVNARFITTPDRPIGPTSLIVHEDLYCTGGAQSTEGDPIEYQFFFEPVDTPGTHKTASDKSNLYYTPWDSVTCKEYYFPSTGTYAVRARARSAIQTDKISAWSEELPVVVGKSGEPPEMRFTAHITDVSNGFRTIVSTPYNASIPDTVGMFRPFSISYHGVSPNGPIRAYWYYQSQVELAGQNRWTTNLDDTIKYFPNVDDPLLPNGQSLPSGSFYFAARCFDNMGFPSRYNFSSGEGLCRVEINYDPGTKILYGICNPRGGTPFEVDFNDGMPDTFPYNSLLKIYYRGMDDLRDSLRFSDPEIPIRFQFQFERWGEGGVGRKLTPWYPLQGAEDTNPCADEQDPSRDVDSTTMRIGTFSYLFNARAFDEQYKNDGTPAAVSFYGNFPPTIDSLEIGFWDPGFLESPGQERVFRRIQTDTLYFGWIGGSAVGSGLEKRADRGDTLYLDDWTFNAGEGTLTKYYRFVVRGVGHDDPRDPVGQGTGIQGWLYDIYDMDGGDYDYLREGDWIFDSPTWDPGVTAANLFEHEVVVRFTIPPDESYVKGDTLVRHPPAFFGEQEISLVGKDIGDTDIFMEGIRAISPEFDGCIQVSPGGWIEAQYRLTNYARRDTIKVHCYFKMVM